MTEEAPRLDRRAVRAPAEPSSTLPPEMAGEAVRRLEWVALLYSIGGILEHFGHRALVALTGPAGTVRLSDLFSFKGFQLPDAIMVGAVLTGFAMYGVARARLLPATQLLNLGLAFQVVGAFGVAAMRLTGAPVAPDVAMGLVPAEAVWIVVYPLVVPSPPKKALVASLLAASTGPAVLGLSATINGITIDRPILFASYYLLSSYLAVIGAYVVARIIYGYSMQLKHAREIGSYELIELIGEGGMGQVWRARHRLLARPAAIKLIRSDALGSSQRTRDSIVRRFEREARDTATLGSPHTIDIYDFGVMEDGQFYYVMELLEGLSLERFVQLYGPMTPARVVHVLRQALHSLGEAHARGLVHRDIKPANIFICRLGPDDDFVKVLDFGLVKHVESDSVRSMITTEGATAGTPAYMAPEIALGSPSIDGRADLYSLACVAYYLLTGRPVFVADTAVATALAHVQEVPTPPSVVSELAIPAALEATVLRTLAKDPADRPASASVLSEQLAAAMPPDGWTDSSAHAWWELHRARASAGAIDEAAKAGGSSEEHQRCWPRLERKAGVPAESG
jgi:serine/threonine-protein kinase